MKRALIVPLLILAISGISRAVKGPVVEGLRYASYRSYTRIVVDLSGQVEFKYKRLSSPDRIYFDLTNCSLKKNVPSRLKINDGRLKAVRIAQFNKNTVRVVLDITKVKNYYAFTLRSPHRLVIDVYSTLDKEKSRSTKRRAPPQKADYTPTIVIDPGHGGDDPGAIGPSGIKEKDITLYVAKRLGSILRSRYGFKVIYTRKSDISVSLNERTEIANRNHADLFVSIHTNASRKRSARGIETYFLNWTNNREAMRVAARENRISFRHMQRMRDSLQMILQDLARKSKNEESMKLAHSVHTELVGSLKQRYRRIEDLGVKYALFYVLVGAEMPSVLVEISFISNREEERRLASRIYRDKIAEGIARGIHSYISSSTVIARRDTDQNI